jgi:retinol dehydrogenase 14
VTEPTVLITGATNGIGRAAALALAVDGAHLWIHGRSRWRTARVVRAIRREAGHPEIHGVVADLADRTAIDRAAERILARAPRLDVLIHNAAVVPLRRELTSDGIERQFAVNHLAPMLLTWRLLPLLRRSAPARVVVVASQLERNGRLDFDDLQSARAYDANSVYATTKLANVLFAAELGRQLAGTGISANSLHPGIAGTGVLNALGGRPHWQAPYTRYSQPHPSGAIETILRLATDPTLTEVTGAYFREGARAEPSPEARDPDLARRLWLASTTLLGLPADWRSS